MAILRSLDDENIHGEINEDIKNANVNLRNHIRVDTHFRGFIYARKFLMHDEHCYFKWKKIVLQTIQTRIHWELS